LSVHSVKAKGPHIRVERVAIIPHHEQWDSSSKQFRRFRSGGRWLALLLFCSTVAMLGGCGSSLVMNANSGIFLVTPTNAAFGTVPVGQTSSMKVSLENKTLSSVDISQVSVSGGSFSVANQVSLPVSVASGATFTFTVEFAPTTAGAASGEISVATTAAGQPATVVPLSGSGAIPTGTLSSLSCAASSFTGSATTTCTVGLSSAAGTDGLSVSLASNAAAVTVPSSVTVGAGATTATFQAAIAAVSAAQTATLTATADGTSLTAVLQLSGVSAQLGVGASQISFGDVQLNTPATQTLTLASTGTQAVTVSSVSLTGIGFTISGSTFPATLKPGDTATLNVQFDPATAGPATGSVTIASTSAANPAATVALSGTGVDQAVQVTWDPPATSTDPVASYHIYRAVSGSSAYALMGSSALSLTSYTDATILTGTTYTYYVTSVDSNGVESVPSNTSTVEVP
jgi:hypothetical protein